MLEDFASMAGIGPVVICNDAKLRTFNQELRWNEDHDSLRGGLIA